MAELKLGTQIGGNLVWHQGILDLNPVDDKLFFRQFDVITDIGGQTINGGLSLKGDVDTTGRVFGVGANISWASHPKGAFSQIIENDFSAHWMLTSNRKDGSGRAGIQVLTNNTGNMRLYTDNITKYVDIAGGQVSVQATMPSSASHLTRKDYVDAEVKRSMDYTDSKDAASNATVAALDTRVTTLDAQNVKITGNQSIAGIKTFSSHITVPAADPTAATQAAHKGYVDKLNATSVKGVTAISPVISTGGINPVISIAPASRASSGSMSSNDKIKLDDLPADALSRAGGTMKPNGFIRLDGMGGINSITGGKEYSIFRDHNNGNVTVGGAGGDLYLGYTTDSEAYTTQNVLLYAPLKWMNNKTGRVLVDSDGFIPWASVKDRIGLEGKSKPLKGPINFDDLNLTGDYNLYNAKKTGSVNPPPFNYGTMSVVGSEKDGNTFVTQIATDKSSGVTYIRTRSDDGTWTAWNKQYSEQSKPTPAEVGAVNKTGDTMTGALGVTRIDHVDLPSASQQLINAYNTGIVFVGNTQTVNDLRLQTNNGVVSVTVGSAPFRIYHAGFKPTAADVGALSATGGSISGEILFTGNGLSSGLRFLPTGSNDAFGIRCVNPDTNTGELEFYSTDDDVEPFVFRHYTAGMNGSGTSVEWVRIDNEGLKVKGNLVYHPGNKPTATDVGAVAKTGDTMTGSLKAPDFIQTTAQSTNAAASTRKDYVDAQVSAVDAKNVAKAGDTMTGNLNFGTPNQGIHFQTATIGGGNGLFSGTGDGASSTSSNIQLKSWFGVGIAPASGNPTNANTIWFNARNGDISTIGDITAKKSLVSAAQGTEANALTRKDYVDSQVATRAPTTHTHTVAAITDLKPQDTNATANTLALRDAAADVHARLLRTTFGDDIVMSGAIAFRVNSSTNNYTRYCNDPASVRNWMKGAKTDWQMGWRAYIEHTDNPMTEYHIPGKTAVLTYLTGDGVYRIDSSNGGGGAVGARMSLDSSGNLYVVGNGNFNDVQIRSDRRLKKNFVKISGALDKVSQLCAYTYDKKQSLSSNDYSTHEVGLIAQDVQLVLPEAVTEVVNPVDNLNVLTISNSGVNALLVEAIKELRAEVNQLRQQIAK